MLSKLLKWVIAILLLPLCAGMGATGLWMIQTLYANNGYRSLTSFALGFGLWIVLYVAFPRPQRSYVFAHECTHALWASLLGQRVHGMNVGRDSGHVLVSDTNFLITLSPYFFPFYTLCALAAFFLLSLAWEMSPWLPFWMGLIGVTWAHHLTFNFSALKGGQEDVRENGWLFSMVVIFLGNLIGLMLWLLAVTDITGSELWGQLKQDQTAIWTSVLDLIRR